MIAIITFTLAFCSIVYELLLGQMLSAYLGNTILRYSVTIGLYMFSMGIGAFLWEKVQTTSPRYFLMKVEFALAFIGGISLFLVQFTDSFTHSDQAVSIVAHGLIILIGVLTGLELPALLAIRKSEGGEGENLLIGINYMGAFLGTVGFAFLFYPWMGLVETAFCVALLNSVAALVLSGFWKWGEKTVSDFKMRLMVGGQAGIFILLLAGIIYHESITNLLIESYENR